MIWDAVQAGICYIFKKKGFDATGIDISPYIIKSCHLRGIKKVYLKNVFQIKEKNLYNTILLLGNNFGLMESAEQSVKVLKKLYSITKDNAIIIAQSMNPHNPKNGISYQYRQSNREKGNLPGQMRTRHRYGKIKGPWHNYLFVSPTEMKKLLQNSGFYIDKIFDNSKGVGMYSVIIRKK